MLKGSTHANFHTRDFDCFGNIAMVSTILRKLHRRRHQHSQDKERNSINSVKAKFPWVLPLTSVTRCFLFHEFASIR
ncbi:hypothetical protein Y032_0070g500 [Ancylostoma ceylanicum]|uniref:Uncharacterized protein n=1 Tax=Ancylostoma ceylanicum TaxID=53326 RepID=A0A016TZ08_9BILA|nr:hypothetical protein Y032_0070g500 [Ancylostoma ceylanicum]